MKMPTTLLLCAALLMPALSQAQMLITEAESAAEQAHLKQGILMAKAVPPPGAPQIEVLEPDMKQQVKAPFAVRVHFVTEGSATVTPASLKVYYGVFGIDITDRLLQKSRFEQNTLIIEKADVPAGEHRLLLKVKDSSDRSSEKLLTLSVTK